MHGHLVPYAGKGVAEGMHRALDIRTEAVGSDEGHARCAERKQGVARRGHADTDGPCRVVARSRDDWHALHAPPRGDIGGERSGNFRAFEQGRHMRGRETAGFQHLVRPCTPRDIEPERARAVRHIGREIAGHAKAQVILRQQHRSRGSEDFRLMLPDPQQLGRREARHREIAGNLARRGNGSFQLAALRRAASVVPQDGRPQDCVAFVQQDSAVHLSAETDRTHGSAVRCA